MNKQFIEVISKIILVFILFIFICILLIKKFLYFNPSKHFLSIQENFDIVNNQHLHGWFLQNKNSNKVDNKEQH